MENKRKRKVFENIDIESFDTTAQDFFLQMQLYQAVIKEVRTKLEILNDEFSVKYEHNPIHNIESRLKSPKSIIEKLKRKGVAFEPRAMREELNDIAGIRVICNYTDDVYKIAEMLVSQNDVTLIKKTDYICVQVITQH